MQLARFAQLQHGVKRLRTRARQLSRPSNNIMSADRRLFSKCDHHVAQQRQDSRKRFSQDGRQFLRIARRAQVVLPQLQQDRAQIMFDLHAMQIHGHFNFRDNVRTVEHSPAVLHVQNLDGKNIRGIL